MNHIALAIAVFAASFLLGSIPWGLIISKVFFHTDIRNSGSGNIGTTNALRVMGAGGGAAVFVLDFVKGLVSGLIGVQAAAYVASAGQAGAMPASAMMGLAFIGCVWGHIFSPWLGFKGGKGIAVAVGALFLVFGPVGALAELAVFIVGVVATKRVSVGSIAAAVACPFFSLFFFWGEPFAWACCTLAAITVIWAHRANIKRLMKGEEPEFHMKKS